MIRRLRLMSYLRGSDHSVTVSECKTSDIINSYIVQNHVINKDKILIPYRAAYALQTSVAAESLLHRRLLLQSAIVESELPKNDCSAVESVVCDRLILLEHEPVYTLGRRGDVNNFVFSPTSSTDWAQLQRSSPPPPEEDASGQLLGIGRGGGRSYHADFVERYVQG